MDYCASNNVFCTNQDSSKGPDSCCYCSEWVASQRIRGIFITDLLKNRVGELAVLSSYCTLMNGSKFLTGSNDVLIFALLPVVGPRSGLSVSRSHPNKSFRFWQKD